MYPVVNELQNCSPKIMSIFMATCPLDEAQSFYAKGESIIKFYSPLRLSWLFQNECQNRTGCFSQINFCRTKMSLLFIYLQL